MISILLVQMLFLLSSDLATLFTGRTYEIKVYPFSFGKYMEYFGLKDCYEALDKYVLEGGMSGSYLYKDQEAKYDYIADGIICNTCAMHLRSTRLGDMILRGKSIYRATTNTSMRESRLLILRIGCWINNAISQK